MSIIETIVDVPADHQRNVFGQFDVFVKKIERTLRVTMIARDGELKIIGPQGAVNKAKSVFNNLIELSKRGNLIMEQNVDYALSLAFSDQEDEILEIDKDIICRTINGKPVKPKTLGQKQYVDRIREKMIVFGVGPAGTGKTYLAMAMAIQAFKDGEVGRIILTRPAIEAGEKLGFLPGDLQSKIDPYLRPLYDALYQIMGPDSFIHNSEKGLIEVAPLEQFYEIGGGSGLEPVTSESSAFHGVEQTERIVDAFCVRGEVVTVVHVFEPTAYFPVCETLGLGQSAQSLLHVLMYLAFRDAAQVRVLREH